MIVPVPQSLDFTMTPFKSASLMAIKLEPAFLRRERTNPLVLQHGLGYIPDDVTLEFLKKNPQLKEFAFRDAETSTILERGLSILTAFSRLRKLSMTWLEVQIPDSSLDTLASLSSLEIFHLSAGSQHGRRHDWRVSHENLIDRLKPLKKLTQIAFTRDIYSYTENGQLIEHKTFTHMRQESRKAHSSSMRTWSTAYAKVFPNLDFIHVGQFSFQISRVGGNIELEGTNDSSFSWFDSMFDFPEAEKRDPELELLRRHM